MTARWKKFLVFVSLPITAVIAWIAIYSVAEDIESVWNDDLYSSEDDDGWC